MAKKSMTEREKKRRKLAAAAEKEKEDQDETEIAMILMLPLKSKSRLKDELKSLKIPATTITRSIAKAVPPSVTIWKLRMSQAFLEDLPWDQDVAADDLVRLVAAAIDRNGLPRDPTRHPKLKSVLYQPLVEHLVHHDDHLPIVTT